MSILECNYEEGSENPKYSMREDLTEEIHQDPVFHGEAGRPGVQQCALCPFGGIRQ